MTLVVSRVEAGRCWLNTLGLTENLVARWRRALPVMLPDSLMEQGRRRVNTQPPLCVCVCVCVCMCVRAFWLPD